MRSGLRVVAALGAALGFQDGVAAAEGWQVDAAALISRYEAYKRGPSPIVSEMNGGNPILLVYEDGQVIFREAALTEKMLAERPLEKRLAGSGFLEARLTAAELKAFLQQVTANTSFSKLEPHYSLYQASDLSTHTIRLRITGELEKVVAVYGVLDAGMRSRMKGSLSTHLEPPAAFIQMHELLGDFRPANGKPWDPGFLEATMSDYSYAPDVSLNWPTGWPDLASPLVRVVGGNSVIKYVMILPSDKFPELRLLLDERRSRGAIQIGEAKVSVGFRWPFPGENNWSTWDLWSRNHRK